MFHDVFTSWERAPYLVPCARRSKVPLRGEILEARAKTAMTLGEVRQRWGHEVIDPSNYAIFAGPNKLTIVDADNFEAARQLYQKLPKTDMMTKTPNGVHFYYQGHNDSTRVRCRVMGIECDIRSGLTMAMGPGSIHPSGQQYERLGNWNLVDVPEFDSSWVEDVRQRTHADSIDCISGRLGEK